MRQLLCSSLVIGTISVLFAQPLIPYRRGKLWGYADTSGTVRIEPRYDEAQLFGSRYAVVKRRGKFEIINRNGQRMFRRRYGAVHSVVENKALVTLRGKQRWINAWGEELAPPKYVSVRI